MNARTLITVLVLAIAALSTGVLLLQQGEQRVRQGEAFLPDLKPRINEVDRVTVTLAGPRELVVLTRTDDRWTVANRGGYPAEISRVRELLLGLAEARVLEAKTSKPELYERLGVRGMEDPDALGARVDIQAGDRSWSVIVGNRPANVTAGAYVRRVDRAQSLLVDRSISVRRGISEWLPKQIVDLDLARLASVTIQHPDGAVVEIGRDGPDAPFELRQPEGVTAKPAEYLRTTADALGGLRLDDVFPVEDGEMLTAVATARYRTFDGLLIDAAAHDGEDSSVTLRASVDEALEGAEREMRRNEADALNATFAGWRFDISGGRFDRFKRRPDEVTVATE